MAKKSRKFISFLLAAAVAATVLPTGGFADSETGERGSAYAESGGENELVDDGTSENVASVTKDGETTYVTSLAEAFTSTNRDAEVKLLKDAEVTETIEIGYNFPASLDLAGHRLGGCETVIKIVNSVPFKILDSEGGGMVDGKVQTNSSSAILTLEGGHYKNVDIYLGNLVVTDEKVSIDGLLVNNSSSVSGRLSAGTY